MGGVGGDRYAGLDGKIRVEKADLPWGEELKRSCPRRSLDRMRARCGR